MQLLVLRNRHAKVTNVMYLLDQSSRGQLQTGCHSTIQFTRILLHIVETCYPAFGVVYLM